MKKAALIIFQKNEELGKVKTRLAVTVGEEKALEIYRILISYTYQVIQDLPLTTYIFFSNFIPNSVADIPSNFVLRLQEGENLGERMSNAFQLLFKSGYQRILILGTDCAQLESRHITDAIQKLDEKDVVIGPAEDGGYYLLGMKKSTTSLFEGIEWSTSQVFSQTIEKLTQAELSYGIIETLSDVDVEEDWEKVKMKFN
jgi:rSAM/selenodomain-associated transferase 1